MNCNAAILTEYSQAIIVFRHIIWCICWRFATINVVVYFPFEDLVLIWWIMQNRFFANIGNLYFKKWQKFGIKNIAKNSFQSFWKTIIFGNICQIWHHLATLLTAISSHCHATLPAMMSAFNSHVQQNACYRNMKWTFEDLLPCYCYAIKTNSRTTPRNFRNLPFKQASTTQKVPRAKLST